MNRLISVFISVFCSAVIFAQTDESFRITSEYVTGTTYDMAVYLPRGYITSEESYPVLYCTDRSVDEILAPALYTALRFSEEVNEIIIVEISCSDDSVHWRENRDRDFTPPNLDKDDYTELDPDNPDSAGGGQYFLSFIKLELIPYIESHYRTNPDERGYFGHSYGGLFGVYAMAREPGLFKKYILGSPSLWYDDFNLIKKLGKMPRGDLEVEKVYTSVGDKEPTDMMKSFKRLKSWFKRNGLSSGEVKSEIVKGETHRSSVVHCLFSGIRFLYGE